MNVRAADPNELPAIKALYSDIIDAMRGTEFDVGWEMGEHPSHEALRTAADAGNLFIAVDDSDSDDVATPLGAFILDGNQGLDYGIIDWKVACADDEVQVIHLLGASPLARGRGVGRALIRGAAEQAIRRGAKALRLDAFDNNAPAVGLYRSCGFDDYGVHEIRVARGLVHASYLMEMDLREGRTPVIR